MWSRLGLKSQGHGYRVGKVRRHYYYYHVLYSSMLYGLGAREPYYSINHDHDVVGGCDL